MTVGTLTRVLEQLLSEPHAGLLAGLLFGTKSTLPKDLYDALVTSGTLHIVALSGMNISILSRMVASFFRSFVGIRVAAGLTILIIVLFVWFVGPSPSIVRAALMGSISLLALLVGRGYVATVAWMITVLIMIIFQPAWLFDISFQLSALATLGIILFAKTPQQSHTPQTWIKENLQLTLSAQVFTIPLILLVFHRVSLVSPFSNLLIGWVIAPLTGLGWITVLLGSIELLIARPLAWIDWILLEYLVRVVYITSSLPGASIGW